MIRGWMLRLFVVSFISALAGGVGVGLIADNNLRSALARAVEAQGAPGLSRVPNYTSIKANLRMIFSKGITVENGMTISGDIEAEGSNLNLGGASITAANIIYSLAAGSGISISGSRQNPTIGISNVGSIAVSSIANLKGDVDLVAGDNVTISKDGNKISIKSSYTDTKLTESEVEAYVYDGEDSALFSDLDVASSTFVVGTDGNMSKVKGVSYVWPGSQGGAGTFLKNDGSGNLSWATNSFSITPDSLDFSDFADAMTLDATTSVAMGGYDLRFTGTGGTSALTITSGGNVGVGTTSPTNKFTVAGNTNITGHMAIGANAGVDDTSLFYGSDSFKNLLTLEEEITDMSATYYEGITTYLLLNPSAPTSASVYAGDFEVGTKAGNSQNFSYISGLYGESKHLGSGSVSALKGVEGFAYSSGGSVTSVYGGNFGGRLNPGVNGTNIFGLSAYGYKQGSGSVGNVYGIYTYGGVYSGGTATNVYGLYIDDGDNGGTVTNAYGLYIDDHVSEGVNSFNLYSGGSSSKNYFQGSLGIGTTSPLAKLDVAGTSWLRGSAAASGGLYVNSSGNVGIGTTSPLGQLDVVGGSVLFGASLSNTSTTDTLTLGSRTGTEGQLKLSYNGALSSAAASAEIDFRPRNSADTNNYSAAKIGLLEEASANRGNLLFYTNAGAGPLERLRIDYSGNVGIGTTVPTSLLNISGASAALDINATGATENPVIRLFQAGTRRSFIQHLDTDDALTLASEYGDMVFKAASSAGSDTDTEYMRIKAGGNVGLGTTSPLAKLDVTGTSWLRGSTASSGGLYVNGSGNVGIGTTTPASLFEIVNPNDTTRYTRFSISSNNSIIAAQSQLTLNANSTDYIQVGGGTNSTLLNDWYVTGKFGLSSSAYLGVGSPFAKGTYSNAGISTADSFFVTSNGIDFVTRVDANSMLFRTGNGASSSTRNAGNGGNMIIDLGKGGDGTGFNNGTNGKLIIRLSSDSSPTGSTGTLTEWQNGSGTPLVVIKNSGNVGIGTTSPTSNLYVMKSSSTSNPLATFYTTSNENQPMLRVLRDSVSGGTKAGAGLYITNHSNSYPLFIDNNLGQDVLVVKGDGSVGIGAESSGPKLYVYSGDNSGIIPLSLRAGGNTDATQWYGKSSSGDQIIASLGLGGWNTATTYGSLNLFSGAVQKILINSNGSSYLNGGNVGIGTTSPSYKFEVNAGISGGAYFTNVGTTATTLLVKGASDAGSYGAGKIIDFQRNDGHSMFNISTSSGSWGMATFDTSLDLNYSVTADAGIDFGYGQSFGVNWDGGAHAIFKATSASSPMTFVENSDFNFQDYASSQSLMYIDTNGSGGNIGIGTTSPMNKLHVVGNGTYAATFMSGNVGIGTTAPGSKLSIAGLGSSTGTALVIDANGDVWKDSSSLRYKDEVQPLTADFEKVLELEPVSYKFKGTDTRTIGYIAEDLHDRGLTDLVVYDNEGKPDAIKYDRLSIYLLEIVKKQGEILKQVQDDKGIGSDVMQDKLASMEASLTSLKSDMQVIKGNSYTASISAFLAQNSGSVLGASSSATLLDLLVSGDTNVYDLAVAGDISTGLLKIQGLACDEDITSPLAGDTCASDISTIGGPLVLQGAAHEELHIMAGKVKVDTDGNIRTQGEITVKKVNIDTSDSSSASAGKATIKAGEDHITINTSGVSVDSLIHATFRGDYAPATRYWIESQKPGESFTLKLDQTVGKNVDFSWMIVN